MGSPHPLVCLADVELHVRRGIRGKSDEKTFKKFEKVTKKNTPRPRARQRAHRPLLPRHRRRLQRRAPSSSRRRLQRRRRGQTVAPRGGGALPLLSPRGERSVLCHEVAWLGLVGVWGSPFGCVRVWVAPSCPPLGGPLPPLGCVRAWVVGRPPLVPLWGVWSRWSVYTCRGGCSQERQQ